MDRRGGDEVGAVFGVEVFEVGEVLEVVRVDVARVERLVGHDVVGELDDLQVDALLGEGRLHLLEDLGVGRRGSADLEDGQFGGGLGGALRGSGLGGGFGRGGPGGGGFAAARGEREGERQRQQERQQFRELFHIHFSFSISKKWDFYHTGSGRTPVDHTKVNGCACPPGWPGGRRRSG